MRRPRKNQPRPILVLPRRVSTLRLRDFSNLALCYPGLRKVTMAAGKNSGLINIPSNHSVDETVEKLKAILQSKGITLFVLIDHGEEAIKAGMKMRPTKLLIFGNPKAGTPVMLADLK
jgi:hypothetical protein